MMDFNELGADRALVPAASSLQAVSTKGFDHGERFTPGHTWQCKVGIRAGDARLPLGADAPMRKAVEQAFCGLTGQWPEFNFSGWGAEPDEPEMAVIENRLPSAEYELSWHQRNAAPDLYEALHSLFIQALQSGLNDPANEWGYEAIQIANAALRKARGEAIVDSHRNGQDRADGLGS
jgi:hypothetical protein